MKQQHTFFGRLLPDQVPSQLVSLNSNDMLPLYLSTSAAQNET